MCTCINSPCNMKLSQADVPRKDTKDAPHSGVPVVSPPHVDDQISDGPNQRNNNPAVSS